MSLSDWIISISTATIGIILGVAAYFAQKWIQSVDETLKGHSDDFKDITKQINSLQQTQNSQTKNISEAIQTQIATIRFPFGKIDNIEKEVSLIKDVIQKDVLPKMTQSQSEFGRVVVLEESLRQYNEKLITMFNAMKILSLQKKRNPE